MELRPLLKLPLAACGLTAWVPLEGSSAQSPWAQTLSAQGDGLKLARGGQCTQQWLLPGPGTAYLGWGSSRSVRQVVPRHSNCQRVDREAWRDSVVPTGGMLCTRGPRCSWRVEWQGPCPPTGLTGSPLFPRVCLSLPQPPPLTWQS